MSDVKIKFLGSGDMFGSGGRFQTCISVDTGTTRFLLDCGASSLIAMKRWGVDPSTIDVILITHLHGDHFGGVPFFILEAQLVSKRTRPLILAGPPELQTRVRKAMEVLFPGSSQIQRKFDLEFVELTESQPSKIESLVVTPYQVIHSSDASAHALRVECEDKIIAYSGDTEWTDALIQTADGADLFVCEVYFYDKKIKYHLDYKTLMARRDELGCKRLIMTHMSDDMLTRVRSLGIEYAEDGKQIVI